MHKWQIMDKSFLLEKSTLVILAPAGLAWFDWIRHFKRSSKLSRRARHLSLALFFQLALSLFVHRPNVFSGDS